VIPNPDPLVKAAVLAEALPYMRRYAGRTLVVKYGGHAMLTPELRSAFCQDIVLLDSVGIKPVGMRVSPKIASPTSTNARTTILPLCRTMTRIART